MSAIFRYRGIITPMKEMSVTEFKELLAKILKDAEIEWYTPIVLEGREDEDQDYRLGFCNNVIFDEEWFFLNITSVFKEGYEDYITVYEEKLCAMFDKYYEDGIIEIRDPVIGIQE